ncbi:MAG: hypothetical protein IPG68_13000 [Micrococcales bacterium]|nr:hypothetical protein [Micrococcales bacterium]
MFGRLVRITVATAIVAGGMVAGVQVPAAQAKTVKVGVKKKSGEMRLLTK